MIYPKTFEQKIGFDLIRQQLLQLCSSPLGQSFVEKMRFASNHEHLEKLLSQTDEFRQIIIKHTAFPTTHYFDFRPQLRKAEIENTWLDEAEFQSLKLALFTIFSCVKFFTTKEGEKFEHLKALSVLVQLDKNLPNRIEHVIDANGHVRDTASTELQRIRRALIAEQSNVRRRLDRIMREAKAAELVADDVELTIRNGRLVIPVLSEHKRKIKGFIHDESATGQTVFIEPAEIFDANNSIKELEYEERREIIRILTQLTNFIRPQVPALMAAANFLGLMDFIRAKALMAFRTDAAKPVLNKRPVMNWLRARHPLLEASLEKQGKKMVPQDITLTEENRILIISGPNAGGKSVCLKTVGLLQYMLQCGLLIPLEPQSEAGVFDDIMLDMGDEQSIENDLSTYSSHLSNMNRFIKLGGKRSLFLIDEFGTGTEPKFGGAIAEAILEALHANKMFGLVTTHYGNLKAFADKTPGVINGAMRFNMELLEPMYQLEIGKPGSSFALEIAEKIGLSKKILDKAKGHIGEKQVNLDRLIRELEIAKGEFERKNTEASIKERKLSQTLSDYTELKTTLESQTKLALNQAKVQARKLLQDANQRIEQTIREIKENKAEKEPTRAARQELEEFKKEIEPEPGVYLQLPEETPFAKLDNRRNDKPKPAEIQKAEQDEKQEKAELASPIQAGSYVRLTDNGAVAEVLGISEKDVEIRIGSLKSFVKMHRLEKIGRREYLSLSSEEANVPRMEGLDMHSRMANFSFTLDIRGKRGEEALGEISSFVDNAIMLGANELRIVHGKGDGILRNLVRNYLNGYKEITSAKDEHADRGGAGITIVTLR